ncbi:hypothetical protein BDK51DRAFT_47323, partial [Blyttiomyces helicus]
PCRLKKLKCNRTYPICSSCACRKPSECVYANDALARNAARPPLAQPNISSISTSPDPDHVTKLESRIRDLESCLESALSWRRSSVSSGGSSGSSDSSPPPVAAPAAPQQFRWLEISCASMMEAVKLPYAASPNFEVGQRADLDAPLPFDVEELVVLSMESYFLKPWMHFPISFFHRAHFFTTFRREPSILLFAIIASFGPSCLDQRVRAAVPLCYTMARKLVAGSFESPSEGGMKALLLLSYAAAVALKLDVDPSERGVTSWIDREIQRRMWHTAIAIDSIISSIRGCPNVVSDPSIYCVKLPIAEGGIGSVRRMQFLLEGARSKLEARGPVELDPMWEEVDMDGNMPPHLSYNQADFVNYFSYFVSLIDIYRRDAISSFRHGLAAASASCLVIDHTSHFDRTMTAKVFDRITHTTQILPLTPFEDEQRGRDVRPCQPGIERLQQRQHESGLGTRPWDPGPFAGGAGGVAAYGRPGSHPDTMIRGHAGLRSGLIEGATDPPIAFYKSSNPTHRFPNNVFRPRMARPRPGDACPTQHPPSPPQPPLRRVTPEEAATLSTIRISTHAATHTRAVLRDKISGLFFGTAGGDAVGLATEFLSPGQASLRFRRKQLDGHTDQAILILESIFATYLRGGEPRVEGAPELIDYKDFARRLLHWKSTGIVELQKPPFGLGYTLGSVLSKRLFWMTRTVLRSALPRSTT